MRKEEHEVKFFVEPEINISKFDIEDVISTSNPGEEAPDTGDNGMGWG